ncbi:COP9 signalosome (CSN) subunit [Podila clonocystis]|nr:COP9 signalosome (CSN) subunit [Podila clonocystis]
MHYSTAFPYSTYYNDEDIEMKLVMFLGQVNHGITKEDAKKVASFLQLDSKHSQKLMDETPENAAQIEFECQSRLPQPWDEVLFHHVMACKAAIVNKDYVDAYISQSQAVAAFQREFASITNWALKVHYMLNIDLRKAAVQADKQLELRGEKPNRLEDCARAINKSFTVCITDRSPIEISRKWGTYFIIGILFKTYFKLKSHSLCKNVLRAVSAADLPPLTRFPISHQVTFKYYTGVLSFYNDDFKSAEADLQFAFDHTPATSPSNRRLILHYLIPTRMLRGSLPHTSLLENFFDLKQIYEPIVIAIKTGNVRMFDEALAMGSSRLVSLGTYLTVERARGVVVRVLFKKVYTAMNKSTKLEVSLFKTALAYVGVDVDEEEVECMLANMIYKGYIRGYLSHEKSVLVLSQKDPFPSLDQQR